MATDQPPSDVAEEAVGRHQHVVEEDLGELVAAVHGARSVAR